MFAAPDLAPRPSHKLASTPQSANLTLCPTHLVSGMGATTPSHGRRAWSVVHLPYDVLVDIFMLLPARDLVHLLCSCRTLYALIGDETAWQSLSGRYGLRDITHFGGRSWYTIYTGLLHTYGPMLGLWAGDHPYTGGIIEISLQAGSPDIPGGIVVDMWRFRALQPEELDGPEMPELPTYTRLARIDFSASPTLHSPARMVCTCDKRAINHRARFELLSPSFQSVHLHTRQGRFPHPDLPSADVHSWVDERRYPRLTCQSSHDVDQTQQLRPHPRVPIVYAAPTSYRKPPAVSMSCKLGCIDRARPFLGFENIIESPPRFYPLHHEPCLYVDPESSEWSPASLKGVWLGSHGPHGTECLYVEWIDRPAELRAWKITGDENVPRGALTWQANMDKPLQLSEAHRRICLQCLGELDGYRFFAGTGVYSSRGYMPHQRQIPEVLLAVGRTPPLRVVWIDEEEVSAYIRYPLRSSEQ